MLRTVECVMMLNDVGIKDFGFSDFRIFSFHALTGDHRVLVLALHTDTRVHVTFSTDRRRRTRE